MPNTLASHQVTVPVGESLSGPTDLHNLSVRAIFVECLPEAHDKAVPVTLRVGARPRAQDSERTPIAFQPVGGGMHLGMHIDAPGYYPAPPYLDTLIEARFHVERDDGEPLDEDFVAWLICEHRR